MSNNHEWGHAATAIYQLLGRGQADDEWNRSDEPVDGPHVLGLFNANGDGLVLEGTALDLLGYIDLVHAYVHRELDTAPTASRYGPMVVGLERHFGGVVFAVADTGGGCSALIGEFGDDQVYITDAPSTGHECHITSQPDRDRTGQTGFAVGVYRDNRQLAYREYPAACTGELGLLVDEVLKAARKATGQ
jgi:hypothetical protein